jgi:hypothetical protein
MKKLFLATIALTMLTSQAFADPSPAEREEDSRILVAMMAYRDECPGGKADLLARFAKAPEDIGFLLSLDALFAMSYSTQEKKQAVEFVAEARKKFGTQFCDHLAEVFKNSK